MPYKTLVSSEFLQSIGLVLSGLIIGLIKPLMDWWKDRRHRARYGDRGDLLKISSMDMRIHDLLTELRTRLECSRALLFQFHNGEHYFSGSSMQKTSCTHESVAGGWATSQTIRMSTPVSLVAPTIESMLAENSRVCLVRELPDSHIKGLLDNLNVLAIAVFPVKQGRDKIVGYVEVHWTREPIADDDTTAEVLRQSAIKIEAVLGHRQMTLKKIAGNA